MLQIKPVRCHYTPTKMAKTKTKKTLAIPNAGKDVKQMNTLSYCWWECKMAKQLGKTLWQFLRKLYLPLTIRPSNPTPRYLSKWTAILCLHKVKWKWKLLSQVWLWDPMDCIVHGILEARTLEWVTFSFSSGSSQPRDRTQVSCIADRFFTS